MDPRGKIVVITGASSGLGRALAVELAQRGAAGVALLARRGEGLADTARAVEAASARALAVATDVAEDASVAAALRQVEATLGPPHIAVANAGMSVRCKAREVDLAGILATFQVNYFGALRLFRETLPGMIAQGAGQIVAVSSVAAWRGLPGNAGYSSSKAALSNLMQAWTEELAPLGVEATLAEPGFLRTEMTANNRFHMPFLMDAEVGARILAEAMARGSARAVFPWQMGAMMKAVGLLPDAATRILGQKVLKRT